MSSDPKTFEAHRPTLLALAYRMLGDLGRAEDMVQETWLRWHKHDADVEAPRPFLVTTVSRLCLDELGSARARREESRSDRLPEPVDLRESGMDRLERMGEISIAFLVLLQRLTAAERAVLLLHDVIEMSHGEIAALLGKNDAASRQLLARARENVASGRRDLQTSPEEHSRLLLAFVQAATEGNEAKLLALLAEDAVFIADGGPEGQKYGRLRSVGRPVAGRERIVALVKLFARQDVPRGEIRQRILNGEPAIVTFRDGRAFSAILIAPDNGKIARVYLQLDPERLRRVGGAS